MRHTASSGLSSPPFPQSFGPYRRDFRPPIRIKDQQPCSTSCRAVVMSGACTCQNGGRRGWMMSSTSMLAARARERACTVPCEKCLAFRASAAAGRCVDRTCCKGPGRRRHGPALPPARMATRASTIRWFRVKPAALGSALQSAGNSITSKPAARHSRSAMASAPLGQCPERSTGRATADGPQALQASFKAAFMASAASQVREPVTSRAWLNPLVIAMPPGWSSWLSA